MDLSLHRLRMLREVDRRGGVTAAAGALHYSPSNVSQTLDALADDVGTPLLERVGRGVRLTEVGRVLAQHAEILLDAEQRARSAVEEARHTLAAQLHVGVIPTVAAGLLPPTIAELAASHPEIVLTSNETDPEDAVSDLRRGDLDLAFLLDYPAAPEPWTPGLTLVELGTEHLQVAAPTGVLPGPVVALSELAEADWIVSGPHTYYGRAVRAACRDAGFPLRIRHQADEQATAFAMVAAGLGVTLVTDLGRVFCPPHGVDIVPLAEPVPRSLVVAHRPDAVLRPAIRTVLATLERVSTSLGLRGARERPTPAR